MIARRPTWAVTSRCASVQRGIKDAISWRPPVSNMISSLPGPRSPKWPGLVACCAVLFWSFLVPTLVFAHEVRPAYLELRETTTGEFSVLWKTPARGEMRLALSPEFSASHKNITPFVTRQTETAAVQTWNIRTIQSLRGQTIGIRGLEGTMTDVLVRIEFADGSSWVQRLTPSNPVATVPVEQSAWEVAGQYSKLGVEHILLGIDHLLFVLALLMITRGTMHLVKTITAFTVAHSITLGLATLGFIHVPSQPVEALIALSIVMVAAEIIHTRRGIEGITARAPWIVAFSFGLLHGLGFAGALSEVGLPQGHIPVALLFFNLGVEAGQLLFIAAVLGVMAAFRQVRIHLPQWTGYIPPYAIGSVAMFWVFQRLSAF
ncbi:MAG: HupE/UreJ family protein [Nitrospirales bacterium]